MAFAPGSLVRVLSLNRNGEVVESARNGRYRVRVGGMLTWCGEDDLEKADEPRRKKLRAAAQPSRQSSGPAPSPAATHLGTDLGTSRRPDDRTAGARASTPALATLDLHGMTVEEALRAVEQRVDLALRDGLDHLDIIHGRGSGRIKVAVHKFLREVGAVRHFAIAPGNPGVTRVRF